MGLKDHVHEGVEEPQCISKNLPQLTVVIVLGMSTLFNSILELSLMLWILSTKLYWPTGYVV